jgi:hypothetical protein
MVTRMRGIGQASTGSLAPSEAWLSERSFRQADVPAVRRFAREFGHRAGVPKDRLSDLVLAVSEACACATAGGPCTARVRLWMSDNRAFCEARGDGMLLRRVPDDTGRTRTRPAGRQAEEEALRRLVLRQLADYMSVADGPSGIHVMLSMTVA